MEIRELYQPCQSWSLGYVFNSEGHLCSRPQVLCRVFRIWKQEAYRGRNFSLQYSECHITTAEDKAEVQKRKLQSIALWCNHTFFQLPRLRIVLQGPGRVEWNVYKDKIAQLRKVILCNTKLASEPTCTTIIIVNFSRNPIATVTHVTEITVTYTTSIKMEVFTDILRPSSGKPQWKERGDDRQPYERRWKYEDRRGCRKRWKRWE